MHLETAALFAHIPSLAGKDVKIRRLPGGLTNRNYRLDCEGERFVLRIMGEHSRLLGIDRRVEHACLQAAHAAGVGPQVVAFLPKQRTLVTRFVKGRVLGPKSLRNLAILRRVVESLRRYHGCSGAGGTFSAFETVRRYYAQARGRRVAFPRHIVWALEVLGRIEAETGVPEHVCHCHNDLLPSNLVDDRRKVWILDWEYAGAGDLFFDLGNLAANNLFSAEQESQLLRCYFGKAKLSDLQRLRLMRLVSDVREAMWGFLQTGISQLDFDYQAYARLHFERFVQGAARAYPEFVCIDSRRSDNLA